MNSVVEQWLNFKFADGLDPDMFVKRRLRFVELALRTREEPVCIQGCGQLGRFRGIAQRHDHPDIAIKICKAVSSRCCRPHHSLRNAQGVLPANAVIRVMLK